jgi:hypothetical protein
MAKPRLLDFVMHAYATAERACSNWPSSIDMKREHLPRSCGRLPATAPSLSLRAIHVWNRCSRDFTLASVTAGFFCLTFFPQVSVPTIFKPINCGGHLDASSAP